MSDLFTKRFWIEAADRAIKSAAQAVIVVWGATAANAWDFDLSLGLGAGLAGATLSLLTSVASAGIGTKGTPTALPVDPAEPA